LQDKPYELTQEQSVLRDPCPKCGFIFPTAPETEQSTAVFKDLLDGGPPAVSFDAHADVPVPAL
jgi:hypothetical protein